MEMKMNKISKKDSATVEQNGVVLNGLTWATRNVGNSGEFVDNPENFGVQYSWEDAQTVCPEGWRLPTKEEIELLLANVEWQLTKRNDVFGCRVGKDENSIFLPYASREMSKWDTAGSYWTDTVAESVNDVVSEAFNFAYFRFNEDENSWLFASVITEAGMECSVRCVKGDLPNSSETATSNNKN